MRRAMLPAVLAVSLAVLMPIAALSVGDEFVMANYTDTRTLDPQKIHDYQSGLMGWNIYEGLLEYDVADFSIRPVLATSLVSRRTLSISASVICLPPRP